MTTIRISSSRRMELRKLLRKPRKQGKVRLVGFTGHKDPSIHLKMLSHGFPFDTVQMPLNPFDATFRSFEQHVLPEARRQGLAVFGMKSLGGSGEMVRKGGITVAEALRYAMSLARNHDHQRHGFDGRSETEPGNCDEFLSHERSGDGRTSEALPGRCRRRAFGAVQDDHQV